MRPLFFQHTAAVCLQIYQNIFTEWYKRHSVLVVSFSTYRTDAAAHFYLLWIHSSLRSSYLEGTYIYIYISFEWLVPFISSSLSFFLPRPYCGVSLNTSTAARTRVLSFSLSLLIMKPMISIRSPWYPPIYPWKNTKNTSAVCIPAVVQRTY